MRLCFRWLYGVREPCARRARRGSSLAGVADPALAASCTCSRSERSHPGPAAEGARGSPGKPPVRHPGLLSGLREPEIAPTSCQGPLWRVRREMPIPLPMRNLVLAALALSIAATVLASLALARGGSGQGHCGRVRATGFRAGAWSCTGTTAHPPSADDCYPAGDLDPGVILWQCRKP